VAGRQESGRQRTRPRLHQVNGDVGWQNVSLLAPRVIFIGNNRANGGDLTEERHVRNVPCLEGIQGTEMEALLTTHRPDDREPADLLRKPREKSLGHLDIGIDALNGEVVGSPTPLFEIEGVDLADSAGGLDENAKPRCAPRRSLHRGTRNLGPKLMACQKTDEPDSG